VIKLTDILLETLTEKKLCPKGRAYYNRRIAAGEKPSAYLSGRAVKVCKGLMKEDDLNEDIDPSEALNDVDAINTLIDRKRDIAFIVEKSNTPENWKRVQQMIKDNDIKIMFVKGNPYNAYIAYLPGSENKATQLKDLAEKYGGYLASNATAEDARKIGKLLGYKEDKIEQYIKDRNIDESLRDWFKKEDWVRIDTQGNITGPCGTMKKGKATTRCLPRAKANRLTKAERAATARKKVAGSKKGKQFVPNTEKAKVKLNK
jgi:translation initiation factor 1 (eIF-1/SUI1)